MKPPHNVTYLEKALRALAKTDESLVRLRRTLANVVAWVNELITRIDAAKEAHHA